MKQPIIALDARCVGGRNTGDTTYWSGLVHGLRQIQGRFQYLLFSNTERPKEIPDDPNFRWIRLPARSDRWWSLVAFPLAARKNGASLIHTQYNLSPLAKGGVTTVHDVSFFIGPDWFKSRDRYLLQRFVPSSVRRAGKVITVSETSRQDIEKYIPDSRGKIRVTPLATKPGMSHIESPDLSWLGINGPFLLTVGTRWPRKNMKLAIDAVERLPTSLPMKLVVTGKPGWGEEKLGNRTVAAGYVSDAQLSALYSAASLFLVPSRYEGFGLTLLEAFTCGCPVLSSSGGSLPEVAGGAAYIEESWEPKDWTRAIVYLTRDSSKLSKMRQAGYRRASDFSWEETARLTEEAYLEAIS